MHRLPSERNEEKEESYSAPGVPSCPPSRSRTDVSEYKQKGGRSTIMYLSAAELSEVAPQESGISS